MNFGDFKGQNWLQKIDGASLVALVLAMCSQIDVRRIGRDTLQEGLGYATKTLAVALPDVVFALVFGWFLVRTWQTRGWKRLWWPPLPCFALIFALAVSALHSPTILASVVDAGKPITKESKEAIAEILQWSGYFILAPWIFVNLILDKRGANLISRRDLALGSFVLAVVLTSVLALVQSSSFQTDAPRALFGSPNVFSAFCALAIPFLVVSPWTISSKRDWKTTGIFVLLVSLLFSMVSPFATLAILIGLGVALLLPRMERRVLWILLFASAIAFSWLLPQIQSAPVRLGRAEALKIGSQSEKTGSKSEAVKKQFVEWGAAIGWNSPRDRAFATGFGPGNYQGNIGTLYASLPNEEKMPPDSNNLWLVQAVSIGILGLGALLWTLAHFWGLAWRAARQNPGDWLGVAVVASLSSWFFVNFFHALVVRGAGLILAFLLALAVVASQHALSNAQTPKESKNPEL